MPIQDVYQASTGRFVRMTLASGYVAMSSSAKAQAGKSHTAYFLVLVVIAGLLTDSIPGSVPTADPILSL